MARERRWIILGEDGRHVSIGRATDPTEAEIEEAGKALQQTGIGGWLAIMDGVYYQRRSRVTLMMVRELVPPRASWDNAVAKFQHYRRAVAATARPQPR